MAAHAKLHKQPSSERNKGFHITSVKSRSAPLERAVRQLDGFADWTDAAAHPWVTHGKQCSMTYSSPRGGWGRSSSQKGAIFDAMPCFKGDLLCLPFFSSPSVLCIYSCACKRSWSYSSSNAKWTNEPESEHNTSPLMVQNGAITRLTNKYDECVLSQDM